MTDARNEYPYQVSWTEGGSPMFCIRAETIEEFAEGVAAIIEAWATAHEKPAEEGETVAPPPVAPAGPTCGYEGCGKKMEWRAGSKDGVPWQGWFCPTRNRAHKAVWA